MSRVEGDISGVSLAVGAAARRVLCNQSCFEASEPTVPAFNSDGEKACSVPSVVVVVGRFLSARRTYLCTTGSRTWCSRSSNWRLHSPIRFSRVVPETQGTLLGLWRLI